MSWTKDRQDAAEKQINEFIAEYETTMTAWKNSIQAGQANQGEAAVHDVLRRWRAFTTDLQAASTAATSNQGIMDALAELVGNVAEQKQILAELESEAATRVDQADSLNPKVRNSPYTNILGLQRTFRDSTRTAILIASVIFGVLALGLLVFLVYQVTQGPAAASPLLRGTMGLGGGGA